MAGIRRAATVLVLRDAVPAPEIFMVRRHRETAFMGGAYVFPGGAVDPSDSQVDSSWCDGIERAGSQWRDLASIDSVAHAVAALRELFEEAGILLARTADGRTVSLAGAEERFARYRAAVHGTSKTLREVVEEERLHLALDVLVPWAHWVTPPVDVRQFDTRFFVARMPLEQTPAHDERETTEGAWMAASDALARAERREIVLPPPTWTTLRELERFRSVEEALDWARRRRIVRREPKAVEHDGRRMLLLPGDPLNPEPYGEPPPLETRFVLVEGRWRAERPPT